MLKLEIHGKSMPLGCRPSVITFQIWKQLEGLVKHVLGACDFCWAGAGSYGVEDSQRCKHCSHYADSPPISSCPQHRSVAVVVPTPTHLCENDDRRVDDSYIARIALTVPTSLCLSQPFIVQLTIMRHAAAAQTTSAHAASFATLTCGSKKKQKQEEKKQQEQEEKKQQEQQDANETEGRQWSGRAEPAW